MPPSVVVATDVFDRFLDDNDLRGFAIECDDDEEIARRFLAAPLPDDVADDLVSFLGRIRYPLAVRSSSLLEDSQYQPFAGIYATFMLPNDHADAGVRLAAAAGGDQARLRLHVLAAREGVPERDAVPARGGEDGGHPPEAGGQPRTARASTRRSPAWPGRTTSTRSRR